MKSIKLMLFFFIAGTLSLSAQNPARNYLDFEVLENSVAVNFVGGTYIFQPYTSEIVETSFIPKGAAIDSVSHAVILRPDEVSFTVSEDSTFIKIDSDGIDVLITKEPLQIQYFFKEVLIISEKIGYYKNDAHQKTEFKLEGAELLFGGGANTFDIRHRGDSLDLNDQAQSGYDQGSESLNYVLPIVLSSKKYLLHFDNAPLGSLDLDSGNKNDNSLTYKTIGGRKTYQLVVGNTWEEILENYTLLTGRQPLPPRWTFGNFYSRTGYDRDEEVEQTIASYKNDSIPLDAVVLDLFWFGQKNQHILGNLRFVRDSFPEPEKMIENLKRQGVQTIVVIEPSILTTSEKWKEAVSEEILAVDKAGLPFTYDSYFGKTGVIDIFKPKAQTWFWEIYKDLILMGIAGSGGNLGELEVHPSTVLHITGSSNEVPNIYGHYWAKMLYEGYREDFPEQRPFILMQAGAAGSQRFGMIPWFGDVNRSWGALKSQPKISLQMGLRGLAYMHSGLGGFASGLNDDKLYVRWLQYGVFQPIFRLLAEEGAPSEPVFKDANTKFLAKKAIELRYKLLPYNYTLAFENSQTGNPLMRPVFFEEPENMELYETTDTYFWGNDFLIAPVLSETINKKEIYFPGDGNWYDFYSDTKYQGGSTALVSLQAEHIPTFVRGGAFIPMAKPMQTTANYDPTLLDVHFYFDENSSSSSGMLYHDDGLTPDSYSKGNFEIVRMKSLYDGKSLKLEIHKEVGSNSKSEIDLIRLHIENLHKPIRFVWLNGIKYTAKNYMHLGKLDIPIHFYQDSTTIKIELE